MDNYVVEVENLKIRFNLASEKVDNLKEYAIKFMKIEEAILYCLASQNRGMRTEQIAEMINRQRLHIRKDGQPVTSNQVYAVICRYPDTFVKAEGRIMLMI